jgi:hypothetical protein
VAEPVAPTGGATRVACEEDTGWASFFDGSEPKVSCGQMNHEDVEKVTSNKALVKTVIYLVTSIFLIGSA